MSEVSRDTSGRRTTLGPSDRAASTSARLVCDLLPGSETTADTGVVARGAGHGSAVLVVTRAAYPVASVHLRGCQSGLALGGRRQVAGLTAGVARGVTGPPGDARSALG